MDSSSEPVERPREPFWQTTGYTHSASVYREVWTRTVPAAQLSTVLWPGGSTGGGGVVPRGVPLRVGDELPRPLPTRGWESTGHSSFIAHVQAKPSCTCNSVRHGTGGHPRGRTFVPGREGFGGDDYPGPWPCKTHRCVGFVKVHLYYVSFCMCILCFDKKKEEKKGSERVGRGEKTHSNNLARLRSG